MSPEKRKPVLTGTGFLKNIDVLAGKIDDQESTPNLLNIQAACIQRRFGLSWPVARATAELHYGRAA